VIAQGDTTVEENLLVGGGELGALLRSRDWSQTQLGAIDNWSDDLKTVVQILLTEFDRTAPPEKTQLDSHLLQDSAVSIALHQTDRLDALIEVKQVEETAEQTWAAVERARTEIALRQSEEQSRQILESITDGFIAVDRNWRFIYVNPTACTLIHRTLNDLIGQDLWAEFPGLVDSPFEQMYRRVMRDRVAQSLTEFYPDHDRWYETRSYPAANGITIYFQDVTDRIQVAATLRQSEEQTRNILESIHEAFFALDDNWQFTYINPSGEALLDRAPGELVGKNLWEEFPGWAGNELAQIYWIAHRDRVAASSTVFYPDRDRWYEVRTYPAANGITVYFRNVTDGIEAENALRESEERYRTLFESIDEGFCVVEVMVDPNNTPVDYRVLEINPIFEQQTGIPQASGKTARELNLEEHWIEIYGRVALTGEPVRFESGSETLGRWFDVYACRTGNPQDRKVAIVFKDISDRKQAEAIIATDLKNTRRLRDLSARSILEDNIQVLYDEIMTAAIDLTRADAGTVQILDQATQDLLLLASQGFDRTMTDRFDRVNASSNTPCGVALARGTRTFVDFDVPESEDPDGSLRMHVKAGYLCAQSTPLISRSGRPMGMVSTHWCEHHRPSDRELRFLDLLARQAADLIEQRQTEAERKQILQREQAAREEAERANRIKDEFLAVLSHELRSPLNPILGWTRLLQTGKLDANRQREALATIERNAKLQTQLIEDLLDISRIMQGKLSLTVAPVSLTFAISAAVETVRLAAEAKNIAIVLDFAPEVAPVSGDAARLQQVVWNLLTNAVKFTPTDGQVTVELRQLDRLGQIRVIDTGKGINPQFLPHVFEYFRQEDGSTTRKFGGLGLGLAIVRQIVEMHGGTVRAESQGEGQGATFIVELPTVQKVSIASEEIRTQTDAEMPLEGIQILLVDDEPDTREFQAFLLEESGASVRAVASGLEALQALEQLIPDVLVSDIGMAQMDGYMLLEHIRSRASDRGGMIPAIALTAYAGEIDRHRAFQVGFQTHITKPVEPEELVSAIAILLDRQTVDS
jgi:PAS domain S-box-containing protein